MEVERRVRYRVNVSTSVKGVKTWDATVEVDGDSEWATRTEVLMRSDLLVASLDQRYPPPTEGGKP